MNLTPEQIEALPSRYTRKKTHLPYDMAKHIIATQAPHATSASKYKKWIKESRSYFMPLHPERVYPNFSWSDYLDTEVKTFAATVLERRARGNIEPRPMWDAIRWSQRYCQAKGITRRRDWEENYNDATDIPPDIPKFPQRVYQDRGYPGFQVWCGGNPSALVEAAQKVTPILTLLHPVKTPQNVLQLVKWADGIGELRNQWRKQSDFDQILGAWVLESDLLPAVDRILSENGTSNGEQWTISNVNQLKWELDSLLEMVRL